MGGNALNYAQTKRKNKEEYFAIMSRVSGILSKLFPATRLAVIQSVDGKESFGDGDVLLVGEHLPADWINQVQQVFNPTELYINRIKAPGVSNAGGLRFVKEGVFVLEPNDNRRMMDDIPTERIPCSAISFDFEEFQIDLIVTAAEDFQIAQVYYAYNDLGNLMGRIADRMGFKYGWNGLWKHVGEGNEIHTKLCVSRNPAQIFDMLGYDYEIWQLGFEGLENMFEYAASTPFFHREPYMLENRNHKDRVRDEKRANYQGFVAWLDGKPWLDKHSWLSYAMGTHPPAREREKARYLKRAENRFPVFRESLQITMRERKDAALAKQVFNGDIVGALVPYKGYELGEFMRFCRDRVPIGQNIFMGGIYNFDRAIITLTPDRIALYVDAMAEAFESKKNETDGKVRFGHLSISQCFRHAITGDRILQRVAGGAIAL